jgi:hypothetical protein
MADRRNHLRLRHITAGSETILNLEVLTPLGETKQLHKLYGLPFYLALSVRHTYARPYHPQVLDALKNTSMTLAEQWFAPGGGRSPPASPRGTDTSHGRFLG